MLKQILLLGGGGHACVVLDTMLTCGRSITGILDPAINRSTVLFGVSVLGGDEKLNEVESDQVLLVNGVGANPGIHIRRKIFESWSARGFRFENVCHPSAVIGRNCDFGEGIQLMALAVVQPNVRVGQNGVVNTRASVDHGCQIGNHVFISPGAILCADISVGDCVFVGAGAVVLPGLKIGTNAILGAGAVVTRTVEEGCVVAGNPAVKIGVNF